MAGEVADGSPVLAKNEDIASHSQMIM